VNKASVTVFTTLYVLNNLLASNLECLSVARFSSLI
jgi:hypothetical protein